MRLSLGLRSAVFALIALFAVVLSSAAFADGGGIRFKVFKGGWVIRRPPAAAAR